MSTRRTRTGPKRPIDKKSAIVFDATVATSITTTVIHTSLIAETMAGIRGNIMVSKGTIATSPIWNIGIVIVRDGQTISTPGVTGGASGYEPEQDVLWQKVGSWSDTTDDFTLEFELKIKTQRLMKSGDTIVFYTIAAAVNAIKGICGVITPFLKQ